MEVRGFDVHDDALMRRFHGIIASADTYQRPWSPMWSYDEAAIHFRRRVPGERLDALAAFDGEEMVGAAMVELPLHDNLDKAWGSVFVEPGLRRRGIGGALVEEVLARARAERRSVFLADTGVPGADMESHPYYRFAVKHGFTLANVEVHRQLDLPVPVAALEAMREECRPHHTGYRLLTADEVPDELLESYCDLENQLVVDAPTGEVDFEAESLTPDIYRERAERTREQGRHKLVTLAVTGEGEAVATTKLVVPAGDMPKVYQWTTLVRRDHRGRRLGAAVKLQNLLALQERYPERTEIHTTNAETNDAMIGINDRLGFRVVEVCPEFQRLL